MLDTVREVHTPEGVALRLPAAGPVPRALAWAIDFAIRLTLLSVCSAIFGALGKGGMGLYLVMLFLVFWAYPIVCEGLFNGQTPGKRVLDLRVVSSDGAPVGWLAACVRNLMRTVDMLPFGYALGLVTCLCDRHGRRLGDLVAGTLVVHTPALPATPPARIDTVLAPPLPLQPAEQMAVIAFADRAPALTGPRQRELADIASPLSQAHGQTGVLRLYAIANWLLGRR